MTSAGRGLVSCAPSRRRRQQQLWRSARPRSLPQRRFVHAQHLEPENVSLSFTLQQGLRPPARGSAELRLSRAMEERVADFEGVQVGGQLGRPRAGGSEG